MKKLFKTLAVLVSALTLLLAVGVFAACGGSGKTTYTVTVKKPDGTAAAGVMISYCTVDDSRCSSPETLDENGQFTFEDETTEYMIKILTSPSDVACVTYNDSHEAYKFEAGKTDIVITLEAKS